jgi:hypothetical protein
MITLADAALGSEAEAVRYISGTDQLPKKMRKLFRDKLDEYRFDQMDRAVKRFTEISEVRHHLIHGEWWFDHLEDGLLKVRRIWKGEVSHFVDLTPIF